MSYLRIQHIVRLDLHPETSMNTRPRRTGRRNKHVWIRWQPSKLRRLRRVTVNERKWLSWMVRSAYARTGRQWTPRGALMRRRSCGRRNLSWTRVEARPASTRATARLVSARTRRMSSRNGLPSRRSWLRRRSTARRTSSATRKTSKSLTK